MKKNSITCSIYVVCLQDSDVFEITDFTTASDWERSVLVIVGKKLYANTIIVILDIFCIFLHIPVFKLV